MGRIKGVARPAIATPIPCPGPTTPTVLLDAGANAECQPEWLVQFAQMGAVFARDRYGIDHAEGRPAVDRRGARQGRPAGQGDPRPPGRARRGPSRRDFVGNVEGRDLMSPDVDVVVTDGFTGNVALKTLEGGMRALVGAILGAFDTDDDHAGRGRRAHAGAAAALRAARSRQHRRRDAPRRRRRVHHQPRLVVGATAIVNAVRVAAEHGRRRRGRRHSARAAPAEPAVRPDRVPHALPFTSEQAHDAQVQLPLAVLTRTPRGAACARRDPRRAGPDESPGGVRAGPRPPRRHPRDRARRRSTRATRSPTTSMPTRSPSSSWSRPSRRRSASAPSGSASRTRTSKT